MSWKNRRTASLSGAMLALAWALSPIAAAAQQWPAQPLVMVVPFSPGGSIDRMARQLAPFMAKQIGQPVTVVNKPGGGGMLGHTYYLALPDNGYNILVTAPLPYIAANIMSGSAPFKSDDFTYVNAQWIATGAVLISKLAPYNSFAELIAAIRDKPGQVSVGVIAQSSEHLTVLLLLEALKIPKENLRIVTYDGGGPVRTAVAGGVVDFAIITAEGSEGILDRVRNVAMISETPVAGFDVPPINTALEKFGAKIPVLTSSVRSIAVQRSFQTKHPKEYEKFVELYKATLERPDFKESARAAQIAGDWLGPDRSAEFINREIDSLQKYGEILK